MSTTDGESQDCSIIQNDENNTLRDVFVKWNEAVQQHSAGRYSEALCTYKGMHELSARVLYNMAMAHIHLYGHPSAKKCLTAAVDKDERLAIAFYQRGLLNLKMKNYGDAIDDIESTRALLRGNTFINYRPLGLFCRLHIFQILYNLSLAYLLAGDEEEAGTLLSEAIYDADHAQRKHISETVHLIKDNRSYEIQPLPLTTEKVFAPPKAITCNLDSPVSWKGSTVVFSADRGDKFGSWDAMKTVEQRQLTSSSKTTNKKIFRKMKSLNDIKVPKLNSELYDRRHSDSNMETILENRHSFRNSLILNRSSTKKKKKFREHSMTLPEDSIIEMVEPSEYDEITHDTTIQWNDEEIEPMHEHHPEVLAYDSETIVNPDWSKIRTSSSKVTNAIGCNFEPSSQLLSDDVDSKNIVRQRKQMQVYRKSYSAGTVENIPSDRNELFRRASKSTGDIEKNRRKSILPLEEKKAFRRSYNIFTNCFIRKKSNSRNDADNSYPTVLMSGCKAVADMCSDVLVPMCTTPAINSGNLSDTTYRGKNELVHCDSIDSGQCKKLKTVTEKMNKRPANTLGTVFGDKTSVVKYALTLACDCLTAVATPTIDHEDVHEKTEQFRRKQKTAHEKEGKRIKSVKNKRAPPPPLITLGTSLAANIDLFAAFAQLNVENDTQMRDKQYYRKSTDDNNNDVLTDREIIRQEQTVDGNDDGGNNGGAVHCQEDVGDSLAMFETSSMMNLTYCELQPCEDSDIYDRTSDSHVDRDVRGSTEKTCSDDNTETYEDESAGIQNTSKATNKLNEAIPYDNVVAEPRKTDHEHNKGSKKSKLKRGSTCVWASEMVRKGSYKSNCFSFKRAKTPPPPYSPPVLKPQIRKRPTSTRRKSRKSSGRKKEIKGIQTESVAIGNAPLAPLTMLFDTGKIQENTQRPSLSSISECLRGMEEQKQPEDESNGLDEVVEDDSVHVFDSVFTNNTTSMDGHDTKDEPNTLQIGTELQAGNKKPFPGTGNTSDAWTILNDFVKSSTTIQHAFDNFIKHSFPDNAAVPEDGVYLCMEGLHNANCTEDCICDVRGDN